MVNSISAQNWQGYGIGFDHEVRVLYTDTVDNLLYVGGNFGYADTTRARGIATWDGISFSGVGVCQFDWDCISSLLPNEWPNPVLGITRYKDTIYAAGFFFTAGSTFLYGNAKFDGTAWQPVCSNPNTTVVRHFIDSNDDLYFMGLFDTICGTLATGIAKYDGNSVASIGSSLDYLMEAIEYKGDIYFGGNFDNNGLFSIARFDGSNFFPVDGGFVGGFSWVSDLEIYKNELYVCGTFYKGAGNAADNIAKWDTITSSWVDVGGGILETTTSPNGAAANKMNDLVLSEDGTINIVIDNSDRVLILGNSKKISGTGGDIFIQPHPASSPTFYNQTQNAGSGSTRDAFIATFDLSNRLIWSTYFGGGGTTINASDLGLGMAIDNNNSLYITGGTVSTTFPITCPSTLNPYCVSALNTATWFDAFVSRFNLPFQPVGIDDKNIDNNGLVLFPNPTTGNVLLTLKLTTNTDIDIVIYNTLGQVLNTDNYKNQNGVFIHTVKLNSFPQGIYFINVYTNSQIISNKIIKN